MKTGLTISASAHAAVLLWALVSFAPKALNTPPTESMPVDLISSTEFSQLRAGARNAPKAETPKPLVEKIAEKKTPADPAAKVVDKPELVTASPQTKKPDPKPQPKFDANRIPALLDKRDPQRVAAAGDTLNHTLAFGTATGDSPKLAQSELDALRARLRECWNPPAGATNAEKLKVPILIRFKQDGTLASPPQPESAAADSFMQAMIDSAVRATIRCQPYTMLSPAKYDLWKEIVVDFSLDGMFGG